MAVSIYVFLLDFRKVCFPFWGVKAKKKEELVLERKRERVRFLLDILVITKQ
jgi:hypothetical protein